MLKLSVLQTTPTILIAIILFVLLIVFYILGYRLRLRKNKKNAEAGSYKE